MAKRCSRVIKVVNKNMFRKIIDILKQCFIISNNFYGTLYMAERALCKWFKRRNKRQKKCANISDYFRCILCYLLIHTWRIMFRAIPHTSILQQLVSVRTFFLITLPDDNRDFLDLVAVRTTVNCVRDHAQMPNVKYTSTGSLAILSSLKESKNSIISAAVPM